MVKLTGYIELVCETDKEGQKEFLVIFSGRKTKTFTVNELIYNFLQHFESPTTLNEVIERFKEKVITTSQQESDALKKHLTFFYEDLVNKKWIVSEDKLEQTIQRITLHNVGDVFLDYKILSVLGNEMNTDVYLVKDLNARTNRVIKLLNRNKFSSEKSFKKYREHFCQEYAFLERFNSKLINGGLTFKDYKSHSFMVLKWVNGISISKFIKLNRLSSVQKIALVLKILKGFAILHQNKVYHGDIHFSNILVSKKLQPTIIDFGYANEAYESSKTKQKPRNGGVFKFIPPERAIRSLVRRFKEVTQFQSEVYQIGLIIYFVFCKELPFQAETWKVMVDEKRNFDIDAHDSFGKRRMPKAVRKFISMSLQTSPDDRFDSAVEMRDAWQTLSNNY